MMRNGLMFTRSRRMFLLISSLYGNCWDFVYDPDNKLIVSVVVGKRTKANTYKVVQDAYQRTGVGI